MTHNLLGRLPPLQAIGRSRCIDFDDPPTPTTAVITDVDPADENCFLWSLDKESESSTAYTFEIDHALSTSAALLQSFKVLNPGNLYCKKAVSQYSGFTHCQKAVAFALKHRELDRLLETRARLEFTKDLLSRINSFNLFINELQQTLKDESQTWSQINQNSLSSPPSTKLENLCDLCNDLRMQLNQWNSIKQMIHTNHRLQPLLLSLCSSIDVLKNRLLELSETAVTCMRTLIHVGFKVLAHCDLERIGPDVLWNIARGLEEFNIIVTAVQSMRWQESADEFDHLLFLSRSNGSLFLSSDHRTMLLSCSSSGCLPLMTVLALISNERAKYAAASAKEYFTGFKDFCKIIKNTHLPLFSWGPGHVNSSIILSRTKTKQSMTTNCSFSGSGSVLVTGNLLAPDLSSEISPLIDFTRREGTFINHFLQIVCHSTCLIKKQSNQVLTTSAEFNKHNNPPHFVHNHPAKLKLLRPKLITFSATIHANPSTCDSDFHSDIDSNDSVSEIKMDHSSMVSSCCETNKVEGSGRKTVSWSDSTLAISIQHVTHDYFLLIWKNFVKHLYNYLVTLDWESTKENKDRLGSVVLCPDTITMIIECMIQNAAVGDTFPVGCRSSLSAVALNLRSSVALAAWDDALNASLTSARVDKCQPTLLFNEVYSTLTGKLLRDAYQPLHSILSSLVNLNKCASVASSVIATTTTADGRTCDDTMDVFQSLLKRLAITADLCHSCISEKLLQLFTTRAVSSFLLVAYSDLQILKDDNERAFNSCKQIYEQLSSSSSSSSPASCKEDENLIQRMKIDKIWKQVLESYCHLQVLVMNSVKQYHQLCLSSSRDFFQNEMPVGKEWKRKQSDVLPIQHCEYIERAVDGLLEPVVSGIGKLQPDAQLEVMTTAIVDVCDAWTSNILTKKIKFSYHGACQLELDVLYVKTWLASYISNTELCLKLLSLDVFKYVDCIVLLLKQQPSGRHDNRRSASRHARQPSIGNNEKGGVKSANFDGTQSIGNVSACTPCSDSTNEDNKNGVSWESKAGERTSRSSAPTSHSESLEDNNTDIDGSIMPHRDQWLALRVHGGTRNWPKLGSCFNNTNV